MAIKKEELDEKTANEKTKSTQTHEHHETGAKTHTTHEAHKESFGDQLQDMSDKAEGKLQHTAEKIENTMDDLADKLTTKAKSIVTPDLEHKAGKIAGKVEGVADKVEDLINDLGSFIPDPNKSHSRSGITLQAEYREQVSRLFIFRFLRLIIQVPVLYIWSIWIGIIFVLQVLHMIILGKRNKYLWSKLYRYLNHTTKWNAFISGFTDQQPKIIEDMPK